ncbi:MAG: acyl-CoA/acyl-ACP dehydrogenase [Actinobacteria bacterium]|nr:acyl-CoA/acyl-ACP dehydrogenase [Actinomycetota bacterium]MDI6830629.1 acyl-CoA dehydrogenase family protein [Actinomycetota bacterium]
MSSSDVFPCMYEWMSDMDVSLAGNLRRWAESELMEKRLELKEDYAALLAPAMRKLFCDIGLQRLFWPEAHGGDGHNTPSAAYTMVAALEQVSRGDTGIALLLSSLWALQTCVATEGRVNDEACAALAPVVTSQDTPAKAALVLPLFRDVPQARARLSRGAWSVEAEKARPASSGADAAVFAVLCALEGTDGEDAVGIIAVPGDAKGVKRGDAFLKTGLAADRNAEVEFAKVKAPEAMCVARGTEACRAALAWFYLGVSASNVGALFACYEILKEWGDNRVIKGKGNIFKDNPLTAAVMAEVAKEISVNRLLTCDLARVLAEPAIYGPAGSEANYVTASMVAHQVTQSTEKAIGNAMEMMASAGYATEWNLERYWRDTKAMQLCLGPYELAKMDVARYFYQSNAR